MPALGSPFRIALVGLSSLAVAVGIGRFAYTPLLPMMQADGLLGIGDGGMLASVHFLGYWLGALFAARLPLPSRAALQLSLIAIALCTLGMGVTDAFWAWLLFRLVAGICSAFVLVLISNFAVKSLTEAGRPQWQGVVFAGVGTGIAATGLAAVGLMSFGIGGLPSWLIFGLGTSLAALVICLSLGPEFPRVRPAAENQTTQRGPLQWRVVIAYGTAGLGYVIPATYLPVMARDIVTDPLIFGWSWPVFGTAALVSTLLSAKLHQRFSNRSIWSVSQIIMAAGLVLPVLRPQIDMIIVAGICVGGTFMIVTMAGMREAHRIAPADDVMRHIAIMTAAFAFGQMIGPVFGSSLYDLTGDFSASLVITSAALVVTAAGLLLPRAYKERPRHEALSE